MVLGTGIGLGGRTAWSLSEDDESGTDLRLGTVMARVGNSMTVVSSGGWGWRWKFSMEVGLCLENKGE